MLTALTLAAGCSPGQEERQNALRLVAAGRRAAGRHLQHQDHLLDRLRAQATMIKWTISVAAAVHVHLASALEPHAEADVNNS